MAKGSSEMVDRRFEISVKVQKLFIAVSLSGLGQSAITVSLQTIEYHDD